METTHTYTRRTPEQSLLYKTLQGHLATFLDTLTQDGKSLPEHVEKELRAYLGCGILANGFIKVKCSDCKTEHLVAFSCKKRGFCPSCCGERMTEIASHLVDNIIPLVPVRQYVLTVPIALRYWMASNKELCSAVYKIFATAVNHHYEEHAKATSLKNPRSGSVTFTQRFGSALNLNVHFHLMQIEGVYEEKSTGIPKFKTLPAPTDSNIANLLNRVSGSIIELLEHKNYLKPEDVDESLMDSLFSEFPIYAECMAASTQQKIATGERRGLSVRKLGAGFGFSDELPHITGRLCATVNGFTLHAARAVPRHQRAQLEQLIQYAARPALATERMNLTPEGLITYRLKHLGRMERPTSFSRQ